MYMCVFVYIYINMYTYTGCCEQDCGVQFGSMEKEVGECVRDKKGRRKVAARWRMKGGCDSAPAVPFSSLRSQSPRAQIMSHVKETHRTYECVMPHIRVRHVTRRKESCHTVA